MNASNPTSRTRRRFLALGACAAIGTSGAADSVFAQPAAVRRLVVAYPPGGFADRLGRMLADALGRASSSTVIVENRPGAGGVIAAEAVARAEADGRTLLLHNVDAFAVERILKGDPVFDPMRGLTVVAGVARVDYVMVANAGRGLRNLADLIALARRSTPGLAYVDVGAGSRLVFEFINRKFSLNLLGVPHRGVAPAMVDLLAGRVDLMLLDLSTALPQVAAGKLTILGRLIAIRSQDTAAIAALSEQGADGMVVDTRFALIAPTGISPALAASLRTLTSTVRKDPSFRAQLEQGGFHPLDEPHERFIRSAEESVQHYLHLATQAGLI